VTVRSNAERKALVREVLTVPNVITMSRLAAVAAMVVAAGAGRRPLVLGLFGYALLTDVIDGRLARAWHRSSTLGAQLDSVADCALYLTIPVVAVGLFPVVRARVLVPVIVVTLAYLVPIIYGAIKYHRLTSYHTFGARLAGVLLSISFVIVLATGIRWPFVLATGVLVVSALEEMLITSMLPVWYADVPSAWHAAQMAAAARRPPLPNTLQPTGP
jgi:phosphatidylglycerophosphate synthase